MSGDATIDMQTVAQVLALAKQAGAEILRLRPQVIAETKADGSPVTIADKTASEMIVRGLAAITPHIPVVSEENPESDNRAILAAHDTYWITDPLDGTRSFLDGHDGFGVHIGLISKGEAVAGIVYFPAQGVAYFTDGATGAYRQQDGEAPARISLRAPLAEKDRALVAISWGVKKKTKGQDMPFDIVAAVGGARLCVLAEGGADAAVTEMPFSYWDIAAAHAVLKAAGGDYYRLDNGDRITYLAGSLAIPAAIAGEAGVAARLRPMVSIAIEQYRLNKARTPFRPAS
jgi:3'(2'), 5'-bisphosphate nucleotidase